MKAIFALDNVSLTDEDGSPAGKKEFLCWNCPLIDPIDRGSGRLSIISETSRLLVFLIQRGVRTIAFCKVRKICDVLLRAVRAELRQQGLGDLSNKVMSYRGGYTAQDRRKIEQAMFNGDLLGIIATTALELGVDIGSLDAVLIVGFPYTISALRQQSGRAGRRKKDSLTVLIADPFPVDQHYMNHPDELFTKPNVEAQIDLENPLILEGHLQCAAYEMPLQPNDDQYFGSQMLDIAEQRMIKDTDGYYHCHPRFIPQPWKHVSIRDIEDNHYVIVDTTNKRNIVLEELEPSRALFTIFQGISTGECTDFLGAIYMHQGNTYLVKELDTEKRLATVISVNVEWTTRQRDFT
jgi:DEAD/DEAH box helicase domain-containing protein